MRALHSLLVLFICASVLAGCGGGQPAANAANAPLAANTDFATPEDALAAVAKALTENDKALYLQCAAREEKAAAGNSFEKLMKENAGKATFTPAGVVDDKGFKVGTMKMQLVGGGPSLPIKAVFIQEGNSWRISEKEYSKYMKVK